MLSGGERNRLLLARLFARPANVLVLDEPTNDLDIESLELLEAALQDYAGTLLLVSHDRRFLDNVVTQTIAAEGDGRWKEYVGGYSDWLRQRPSRKEAAAPASSSVVPAPSSVIPAPSSVIPAKAGIQVSPEKKKKLSYKETRELAALPQEIEALEAEQKALHARMHAPDYYRQPPEALKEDQRRNTEIDALLEEKLERWTALESQIGSPPTRG
jgi:ATP-binding cassette subfamily F protein uup